MAIQHRQLQPDEEPAVIALWAEEIGVPPERIRAEFATDPDRLAHTRVAVNADREIVSAVHYFVRYIRDRVGVPQKVGAVAGVATRPAARRQGIAGQLIAQTLEAMRTEGCTWSLLFTEINSFYEKFGWRTFQTGYRQGILSQRRILMAEGFTTRPYDPDHKADGWQRLATIYDAYNASRSLTTVRDLAYWHSYAALRLRQPHITIFVAGQEHHPEQLIGYVVVHIHSETIAISELAVLPGHTAAVAVLIGRVQGEAHGRGIRLSRVFLPREPIIDVTLRQYFQEVQSGSYEMLMGRPLAAGYTMEEIEASFTTPGAIAWPTDDF